MRSNEGKHSAKDILAKNKERILKLWEERARLCVPAARTLASTPLRNSLPELIDELVNALDESDPNYLNREEKKLAREHGEERSQAPAYDLAQLIEEYQILRQVIFEILDRKTQVSNKERNFILDAIIFGIRNAASEFLRLRDARENSFENRLQQSDERFRLVVEGVKDHAIIRTDPRGIIEDWNPGAENVTGWSRKEVLGKKGSIIFTPEDLAKGEDEKEMRIARETGKAEDNRWHIKKDGSRFFATGAMNPLKDAKGQLTGFVKVFRDFTEKREEHVQLLEASEQAISSREELYQLIMQAPVPMVLVSGPDHRFILANPPYENLFGRSVTGKTVLEVFSEEEVGYFVPLLDSVYETGKPYHGNEVPLTIIHEKGEVETKYLNFGYHPFRSKDGSIKGVFAVAHDVTEQVLSRQRVEESEARFRELANALPLIVWTADSKGHVDWYNDWWYQYLGQPRGTKWDDEHKLPMHPEDVARTNELWPKVISVGAPFVMEQRFRRGSDGEYRWHLVRGVPVFDENGKVARYVGGNTDIHEQKLLADELKEARSVAEIANQMKTSFLANMSHEIRTPIGVIQGFADLLSERDIGVEEKRWVETIRRNTRQLTSLIGEILDLSKVEADKLEVELVSFKLSELVDDLRSSLSLRAEDKGLALIMEIDSTAPEYVISDPTRLRQILINLIGNAIKFTEAGYVRTRFSHRDKFLLITISDTGIGLSEDQQQKIFDPFVQADSTMTRRFGGTGLGLSISRKLAEALGGELKLITSQPDKGSTFEITVCCVEDRTSDRTQSVIEQPAKLANFAGRKILVVDDSADNRMLLERMLHDTGAIVATEPNGRLGLERAMNEDFEVVLMDIQMPEMDGYAAIRILREKGYRKPVLALTAHALKEERDRAMGMGFDAYITKPINKTTLHRTISAFLR